MRPTSSHHHLLQARRPGWLLGIGSVVFLLLLMAGREGPARWGWGGEDPSALRLTLDIMAGTCAFCVLIAVAGRHEVHVDPLAGVFSLGWRFLGWNRHRVVALSTTGAIFVTHKTWRIRNSRQDVWTLHWIDHEQGIEERITQFGSHELAQGHALALARLLDCPLRDATPRHELAWDREDVHFHLGDRRRWDDDIRPWPLPWTKRVQARIDGNVLRYRIPTFSVTGGILSLVAGVAGAVAIFLHACATSFDARGLDPNGSFVWWSLLALLAGTVGVLLAWDLALGGHQVLVSREGVARAPALMPRWAHRMPVETLDHLAIAGDGKGMTLITATGRVCIASRINAMETRALHDLVRLALVGRLHERPPAPPADPSSRAVASG